MRRRSTEGTPDGRAAKVLPPPRPSAQPPPPPPASGRLSNEDLVSGSFALSKLGVIAMCSEMEQVLAEARVKLVGIRQRYTEMMTPGTKRHHEMVEALYRASQERKEAGR